MSGRRRLVDTNLIVRFLVQDHQKHANAATNLFEACDRRELTLVLLPAVLAECVFVLESFYNHAPADIAKVLARLIRSPGIHLPEAALHLDALARYRDAKVHFVDCMIAAHAAAAGLSVATFDNDFKKFPDVKVEID
jgi:predicted nucleic-acid-binding protein